MPRWHEAGHVPGLRWCLSDTHLEVLALKTPAPAYRKYPDLFRK